VPSAPTITQVIDDVVPDGQPPQSIPNGGVTNDAEPVIRISLGGSGAVAGDTLVLRSNARSSGYGTYDTAVVLTADHVAAGFVEMSPGVKYGDGSFTTLVNYAAGGSSPVSDHWFLRFDLETPRAGVHYQTDAPAGGGVTSDNTVELRWSPLSGGSFQGPYHEGDTFQFTVDGHPVGPLLVLNAEQALNPYSVNFSFTTEPLSDGEHVFGLLSRDAAGNSGSGNPGVRLTVSNRPAPTILEVVDDVGPQTGPVPDLGFTNDTQLTVKVSIAGAGAQAGDKLVLHSDYRGGETLTVLTAADIAAGYVVAPAPSLQDMSGADWYQDIQAAIRYENGGSPYTGAWTADHRVRIDTTPPRAPSIESASDDGGAQHGTMTNGATTDDATPTFNLIVDNDGNPWQPPPPPPPGVSPGHPSAPPHASSTVGEPVKLFANGEFVGQGVVGSGSTLSITSSQLAPGTYSFTAIAYDKAGYQSQVSQPFTLTIAASTPGDSSPVLKGADGSTTLPVLTVNEANLAKGTAPDAAALTKTASILVDAADGVDDLWVGQNSIVTNGVYAGPVSYNFGSGRMTVTYDTAAQRLDLSYTLQNALNQGGQRETNYSETVKVVDADGDLIQNAFGVKIIDDGVVAVDDSRTIQAGSTTTLTGNLFANDRGADGFRLLSVGNTETTRGTLTVQQDGSYSYQLKPGATAGEDVWQYAVQSGDASWGTQATGAFLRIQVAQAPSGLGQVINSAGPGSTLTGGAGNDTLNASRGPDVLTGGGGGDKFAWADVPWSNATVTDFALGSDRLDLSGALADVGYTGSDPVADGYIRLVTGGGGNTWVYLDSDGRGTADQWGTFIIDLKGVTDGRSYQPSTITWAQLTGGGSGEPPPPPPQASVGFYTSNYLGQNEGSSGVTTMRFTVNRQGETSGQTTVQYSVLGAGSAPADAADFSGGTMPAGTLTFAPGETSKFIDIAVVGDSSVEPNEGFTINLQNVTGGTLGPSAARGDILNDDAAQPPPSGGQVINSPGPGSTLTGGSGNDTLNASRGPDVLTGGSGADKFAWADVPWSNATVTDFALGSDRLDLSGALADVGYTGSDPVADGYIRLVTGGGGNTWVYLDSDGRGTADQWGTFIIDLKGVTDGRSYQPSTITWAQLTGGGSGEPPPPPPPPPPPAGEGVVVTSPGPGSTLNGGAGNDTLISSRGSDVLVGGGGADHFEFRAENWAPAEIRDFQAGADKIDVSAMLDAAGYTGSNPFADGWLKLISDDAGGTKVLFDHDGPGGNPVWPNYIIHVVGVGPGQIGAGDWIL
jgi:Ca2+-binding RTX toxin-like protein